MKTTEAVRNRILQLCQERNMTINRLATVSALPPSSIKNILYGKSQNPKLLTIKAHLRWAGHHSGAVFLHAGVRRPGAGAGIK